MPTDETSGPLTVGLMAGRTGLSPKALRHYDRIGLLRPASVDAATGYRRYDQAQVAEARLVSALHRIGHLIDEGIDAIMSQQEVTSAEATAGSPPGTGTVSDERTLAAQLFNETWRLLQREGRSQEDDDRMVHTAHASRYHWGQVPTATPAHLARGEWQVSRVYAVLGRSEPAIYHAQRVVDICQANGIGDWDLAFGYEALARAFAVASDAGAARAFTDKALAAAESIAEDEDRDLLLADLETIPRQPRYW
jgi:DNA-binding transcriptional MerR regulator